MNRLLAMFPGPIVLTDGACATVLFEQGLEPGQSADAWNLTHPDSVFDLARLYVAAGSQILLTNTFQANALALADHGLASQARRINEEGVRIAQAASEGRAKVFGCLGSVRPGAFTADDLRAAYHEQAEALAATGADGLVLETFSDLTLAEIAMRAAASTGLPFVASFTFGSRFGPDRTFGNVSPTEAAHQAEALGASAMGVNCGEGPEAALSIARQLAAATELPLWVKPNAGVPDFTSGRALYPFHNDAFVRLLPAFLECGVRFLGGCCGTGPETIRALRTALNPCGRYDQRGDAGDAPV
ncbi:MAG: homocysteine S-methyltransferase family protein [Isosphaeraceae bacterium]